MKAVAIITARGGSKRIPNKNIRDFFDRPIISYSINAALQSGLFDEVMVSTDSEEIAQIARHWGAEVPFPRSDKNSDDFAGTVDVLVEVINKYKELGKEFEKVCCIYPTAPLISSQCLQDAHDLMVKQDFDSVFPVVPFGYPILRGLKTDEKGLVSYIWPENEKKRSQDLAPAYYDAGQFYWLNTLRFLNNKAMVTHNSGVIEIDEMHAQDIDTEIDWKMAEVKYIISNNIKQF